MEPIPIYISLPIILQQSHERHASIVMELIFIYSSHPITLQQPVFIK